MKKLLLYTCLLLTSVGLSAQSLMQAQSARETDPEWVHELYRANPNFFTVVDGFRNYYNEHAFEKNRHTQYFKRWMKAQSPYFNFENGQIEAREEFTDDYLTRCEELRSARAASSAWIGLGPFDYDRGAASMGYAPGTAHVYTLDQSVSDPNIMYAGTATAGIWKTINKGLNWFSVSANMDINEVRAIQIDPTNPDIVYAAADDGRLYKTVDGGVNWISVGGTSFGIYNHTTVDLLINPLNSNTLWLCSNYGFWRSTDAGLNFVQISSGSFQEVELKPNDTTVLYCVKATGIKTEFYKSTDGGASISIRSGTYPNPVAPDEQRRSEIAVTAAAPDNVYVLAAGEADGGYGLYGFYVSRDAGETFNHVCCGTGPGGAPDSATGNINILDWDDNGMQNDGQYYYDLALAVSPVDSNDIYTGGISVWRSDNGGQWFYLNSSWVMDRHNGERYTHADLHDLKFFGNEFWTAGDGGIYYSTNFGDSTQKRMNGIQGTDFWGFGSSVKDGYIMLGGTYHNGTLLKDNDVYTNGWHNYWGGDDFRGYVNPGKTRITYNDLGKMTLPGDRTKAIAVSGIAKQPNASYYIGESGNFAWDPRCTDIVYSPVGSKLWKSSDNTASWTLLNDFAPGTLTNVRVSPVNPNVIYVVKSLSFGGAKSLWKSTDAGLTFTNCGITSAMIGASSVNRFWDIALSDENENELWLAVVDGLDGYKVFHTTDLLSWTNLTSTTLNGENPTCIEYIKGSGDAIYLATRRAVYYRDGSLSDWNLFNLDLPVSTTTVELQTQYREGRIICAGNRGVYAAELYNHFGPKAQLMADRLLMPCKGDTIRFYDASAAADSALTFNWSFPGGIPASSSSENPKIYYANTGSYDVQLIVSNAFGSDTQFYADLIEVYNHCSVDTVPGYALDLKDPGDYATIEELPLNSAYVTMMCWVKAARIQDDYTGVLFSGSGDASGLNVRLGNELGFHWKNDEWWWSSGLYVPVNEWAHLALVVTPDSISVYLNGIRSTDVFSTGIVDFNNRNFRIGIYKDWTGRNWDGLIDEVSIWSRSLSQAEIREMMHLTKSGTEAGLIAYYQFNEDSGPVLDKVGARHANMGGLAGRSTSTVPAAAGHSYRMNVNASGLHDFQDAFCFPDFNALNPNGEVVISKLNVPPDYAPSVYVLPNHYWIMNNYGDNSSFDELNGIGFEGWGYISETDEATADKFKLYRRPFNADGNTWGSSLAGAQSASAHDDYGNVAYNNNNGLVEDGQYLVVKENGSSITPAAVQLQAYIVLHSHIQLDWTSLHEMHAEKFIIERSSNGSSFSFWSEHPASGNSLLPLNYSAEDHAPMPDNYYRVILQDSSGNQFVSNVEHILSNDIDEWVQLGPSMAFQGNDLVFRAKDMLEYQVKIVDADGRVLFNDKRTHSGRISTAKWASGVYHYQIQSDRYMKSGSLTIVLP